MAEVWRQVSGQRQADSVHREAVQIHGQLSDQRQANREHVETLQGRLQDARVAVVGYQMDCANLSSRNCELEAEVEALRQRCAAQRGHVVAAFGDEVVLKERLEQIQMRCGILEEREAELTTSLVTDMVKDQATVRFLRCHLHEAAARNHCSNDRLATLRRQCSGLAVRAENLEASFAAKVDEAPMRRTLSKESVASSETVRPAQAAPVPPPPTPDLCAASEPHLRRLELQAKRAALDSTLHQLEALKQKVRGLGDTLTAACQCGPGSSAWPPGLPEQVEASLSPFLGGHAPGSELTASDSATALLSMQSRLEAIMAGGSLPCASTMNGGY